MATKKTASKKTAKRHVIVRAYSGLFFGALLSKSGQTVELADARQIWSWGSAGMTEKANTAGDIAVRGLGTDSKVSSPVARATIEQVGAMFYAQPASVECFAAQKWGTR